MRCWLKLALTHIQSAIWQAPGVRLPPLKGLQSWDQANPGEPTAIIIDRPAGYETAELPGLFTGYGLSLLFDNAGAECEPLLTARGRGPGGSHPYKMERTVLLRSSTV